MQPKNIISNSYGGYNKMKVLVTGATGLIGLPLTKKLLSKGYNVRCLVRKYETVQWVL